mmetsp:Transcript_42078/g.111178  ORF Transcript_42078/g.111178 Transcript_42078/m.111178 type:complete len:325 (-) Transcript_42078:5-979(-)
MVDVDSAKAWMTLRGRLKSRLKVVGPIFPYWQTTSSGVSGRASWKFLADARIVRPLNSSTRDSTSLFQVGHLEISLWASQLPPDGHEARSPRPSTEHHTTGSPSASRAGTTTSMQRAAVPVSRVLRRSLEKATCCFPMEAHDWCFGEKWQRSHLSCTSLHSRWSLLWVMVNAGLDESKGCSLLSSGSYMKNSTLLASGDDLAYIRKSHESEKRRWWSESSDFTTWHRSSFCPSDVTGDMTSVTISRLRPFSMRSASSNSSCSSTSVCNSFCCSLGLPLPSAKNRTSFVAALRCGENHEAILCASATIGRALGAKPAKNTLAPRA